MQTEIWGCRIIWHGCVNNSMAWQGAGERVIAGEKEIERETEREMRNKQKKLLMRAEEEGTGRSGGSCHVIWGSVLCARSLGPELCQCAMAGLWFIRRAAPDATSCSPVPTAFMAGLPDGADSAIRAVAEPRQFLLHSLITCWKAIVMAALCNNNNSIGMSVWGFWSENRVTTCYNEEGGVGWQSPVSSLSIALSFSVFLSLWEEPGVCEGLFWYWASKIQPHCLFQNVHSACVVLCN